MDSDEIWEGNHYH